MSSSFKLSKINNVLWSLAYSAFAGDIDRMRYGKNSLPLYLYDKNIYS